jgi:hypothetical protein
MSYTKIFQCGNYVCKLDFDGVVTFVSFWWTEVPKQMTGPMQISYEAACQQLCKEAFVPYDTSKFTSIYVKALGPLNAVVV